MTGVQTCALPIYAVFVQQIRLALRPGKWDRRLTWPQQPDRVRIKGESDCRYTELPRQIRQAPDELNVAKVHAVEITDGHDSASAQGGDVGKMVDAMQHSVNSSDSADDYGRRGIIWVESCEGQCRQGPGRIQTPHGTARLLETSSVGRRALL